MEVYALCSESAAGVAESWSVVLRKVAVSPGLLQGRQEFAEFSYPRTLGFGNKSGKVKNTWRSNISVFLPRHEDDGRW